MTNTDLMSTDFSGNLSSLLCEYVFVIAAGATLNFIFTTSETEVDYYYHKVNVTVTSRVAERLILGNFKKIPEILVFDGKYPASHPKSKF